MDFLLLLLALVGHAYLWAESLNRIHAAALPRWVIRTATRLGAAWLVLVPLAFGWWFVVHGMPAFRGFRLLEMPRPGPLLGMAYLGICWILSAVAIGTWAWQGLLRRPPKVLRFHRTRAVDLAAGPAVISDEHAHHFLVHLPGNESLRLDMTERTLEVPRLPAGLDGLSIVHVSDFHFTGRVGKAYFREVVRMVNETQADLVAVTGDLVDESAYIDWLPDTLGKLTARFGVYYILGNHDRRTDMVRLRATLAQCGLIYLGGRWMEVAVRGVPIVLAGNELPWLGPAADMSRCPPRNESGGPLRIVLAHTPDQLAWARARDADLMLAGHTHGGQIRIPLIGAVLTPSWKGVKYASGVFHAPPTIMHVTRGVSGELPLRLNCPPEMAHLVLRRAVSA